MTPSLPVQRVLAAVFDVPIDALGFAPPPAPELLGEARGWLDRTLGLLGRRTSLSVHRELLVSAGWLAALVACLHYDTGDADGAETWREATSTLGSESGHAEIAGWSHEIAAWMALTSGQTADALTHAKQGSASTAHPV